MIDFSSLIFAVEMCIFLTVEVIIISFIKKVEKSKKKIFTHPQTQPCDLSNGALLQYFYHGEPYLLGIASFMIESTKNSSYGKYSS